MRGFLLSAALLAGAGASASCARAPVEIARPVPVAPAPAASAEPELARATRCAAEPSTVYGAEQVVFVVEGEGAPDAKLPFELRDERGRRVSGGSVTLPGRLTAPDVGSGDFLLIVGDGALRCAVTVNRELVRASQKAQ